MSDPKPPPKKQPKVLQLNYEEASAKYLEFHNAWQTPLRIVSGAWGCGKSIACAYEIISHLTQNPDYIGKTALVVAMTSTHAKKQLWEQCFKKVLTNKNKRGIDIGFVEGQHYTVSYKDPISVDFRNGSKIIFASLEQKQALAGWSVSMVFCDELDKLPDPEIWELIQSRARGESKYNWVIATCNPQSYGHWLYQRYFKFIDNNEQIPGVYAQTFTMYDNKFVKDDWKKIEERYAKDPLGFRQAALGEWLNKSGLVLNMFDQDKHTYSANHVNPVDHDCSVMAGLDFGGAFGKGDETACVWVARKKHLDGLYHYYVFMEHFENNLTLSKRAEALMNPKYYCNTNKPTKFISDHASEVFAQYKEYGLKIQKAEKGKGSIEAGIDLLNELFFKDRLHINEVCRNMIRELLTWSYKQTGNNAPEDKNNHCCDALRYVMRELEGKGSIISLTASDRIDTIQELQSPYISSPITSDPAIGYLSNAINRR